MSAEAREERRVFLEKAFHEVCSDFTFRRALSAALQRAERDGVSPHMAAMDLLDEVVADPMYMPRLRILR